MTHARPLILAVEHLIPFEASVVKSLLLLPSPSPMSIIIYDGIDRIILTLLKEYAKSIDNFVMIITLKDMVQTFVIIVKEEC